MAKDLTVATGALTPDMMIVKALESGAQIETLERLMGLHERHTAAQARVAFEAALAAAKAEFEPIQKSNHVDYTHNGTRTVYDYEDLSSIRRAVGPALIRQRFSYRWTTSQTRDGVIVTCILSHESGHTSESTLGPAAPDTRGGKNPVQAIGSTTTYLQRYTLKAVLGLDAEKDDDGRGGDLVAPERDARPKREPSPQRRAAEDAIEHTAEQKARDWAAARIEGLRSIANQAAEDGADARMAIEKAAQNANFIRKIEELKRDFPAVYDDYTERHARLLEQIDAGAPAEAAE